MGLHFLERTIDTHVSSDRLDDFLEDPLSRLLPFTITVYNNNNDDFEFNEKYYQSKYKNIRFRRTRRHKIKLSNNNAEENISPQLLIPLHHESHSQQQPGLPLTHDLIVRNIDKVDRNFVCQSCHFILRQPYQLSCGHRQCQSCLNIQRDTIRCFSCSKISTIDEIRFDDALVQQLECVSILCSLCDWTGPLKTYQGHLEQIEQSNRVAHYLTAKHQLSLLNIICQLLSVPTTHDSRHKIQLLQNCDALFLVSNDATLMANRLDIIKREFDLRQHARQLHNHELTALRVLAQYLDCDLSQMRTAQHLCLQQTLSLRQHLEDRPVVSFDGSLKWKITDIQQKMSDAIHERQRSVYSPDFYTSLFGYRMCSRLFLNGNNDARDTHMSIFFVLMRHDYDAIVRWPFHFKVIFSLLAKDDRHHLTKCFWPDLRSICFQRPTLEMNEGYGIEKFISLDNFQQNYDQYVTDDTLFVKVEVDFLSKPSGKIVSTIPCSSKEKSVYLEVWSDEGEMLREGEHHTDTNDDDSFRRFLSSMERSNIPV